MRFVLLLTLLLPSAIDTIIIPVHCNDSSSFNGRFCECSMVDPVAQLPEWFVVYIAGTQSQVDLLSNTNFSRFYNTSPNAQLIGNHSALQEEISIWNNGTLFTHNSEIKSGLLHVRALDSCGKNSNYTFVLELLVVWMDVMLPSIVYTSTQVRIPWELQGVEEVLQLDLRISTRRALAKTSTTVKSGSLSWDVPFVPFLIKAVHLEYWVRWKSRFGGTDNVLYKKTLLNQTITVSLVYFYSASEWSPCLVQAGCVGSQHRLILCINLQTKEAVHTAFCEQAQLAPLEESRICASDECSINLTAWSPCSAECGIGEQIRDVECSSPNICDNLLSSRPCIRSQCDHPSLSTVHGVSVCSDKISGKLFPIGRCGEMLQISTSTSKWEFTSWLPCSKSCDGGVTFRNATCKLRSSCLDSPVLSKICNSSPCKIFANLGSICVDDGYNIVAANLCTLRSETRETISANLSLAASINMGIKHLCPSETFSFEGACCTSDVLDSDGRCCKSRRIDPCGVCDGASVYVDISGACCETLLDSSGICCASGRIDRCGVCDGTGSTCNTFLLLRDRRLRSLADVTDVTGLTDESLADFLALQNSSYSAEISGICGNSICEIGEDCSNEETCCASDCPFVLQKCPETCAGKGKCVPATGVCSCFSFGGSEITQKVDCGHVRCAAGFIKLGNSCVIQSVAERKVCPESSFTQFQNDELRCADISINIQSIAIYCGIAAGIIMFITLFKLCGRFTTKTPRAVVQSTAETKKTRKRSWFKSKPFVEEKEFSDAVVPVDSIKGNSEEKDNGVVTECWAKIGVSKVVSKNRARLPTVLNTFYCVLHSPENEIRYYEQMIPSQFGNVFVGLKGTISIRSLTRILVSKNAPSRIKLKQKDEFFSDKAYKIQFETEECMLRWKLKLEVIARGEPRTSDFSLVTPKLERLVDSSEPSKQIVFPSKQVLAPPLPPFNENQPVVIRSSLKLDKSDEKSTRNFQRASIAVDKAAQEVWARFQQDLKSENQK